MMQQKQSKLKVLWMNIVALTIGIPSPYGRLRPQLFFTMKQLNDEVNSLRERYDYALKVNERQDTVLIGLKNAVKVYHEDLRAMSLALKDISNNPNSLSPETQAILDSFKVK